ncbi:MAG: AAA family ATPase [Nitrospinota bacterium]
MAEEESLSTSILIIDPAEKLKGPVEDLLEKVGGWEILGSLLEWEGSAAEVGKQTPAVVIVNLDAGLKEGLETAEKISSVSPHSVLLGVSETEKGQGGEWLIRGVRAGFRDFLKFPLDEEEVVAALSRVAREVTGDRQQGGQVVTLFSPRGGSGLTTLAVNLGIVMAKQLKKKVAIIDLDLELGDVTFFLNLRPGLTIGELSDPDQLPVEQEKLQDALLPHVSGVEVLPAPTEIHEAEKVSEEGVAQIIQLARGMFDFVLVNTARNFSPITLRAMDFADVILLLSLPHLAAIADARRTLEVFKRLGFENRVRLVVNRMTPDEDVTAQEVEKALERPIFMLLPSDYRQVMRAINRGLSLWEYAPRSQVTRSVLTLAQKLSTANDVPDADTQKKKKRGWF